MTAEYFIDLLSDFLNKKQSMQDVDVNWEDLIRLAKLHEVTGVIYHQCKNFIPEEYRYQVEQSNASTVFFYANRLKEETCILQKLRAVGIRCFIIKGSAVAKYYPIPALRTMGDSDIVVDDANRAHEILMASGYVCKTKNAIYYKNDLLFEIHDHITHETAFNNVELVSFFNDYWGYVRNGELDWGFHLMFLILHLRSHFYGGGVGIRQFMDIAVLTKYNDNIDWSWIEEKLKRYGMLSFAQKVFDLNYKWFGIKAPVETESVDEVFFEEATTELCYGGVFGNGKPHGRKDVVYGINHPILGMIRRAGGIIFIPYKELIRIPRFKFLVGRPYLLPFAWIYRGWLTIKRRGLKYTLCSIKSSFVSSKDIEKQNEYIDKWNR